MNISDFYENTLGANLSNPRWSWGAYNPITNRLFLRVWRDQKKIIDGKEVIAICSKNSKSKSRGYPERIRHVDNLRKGIEGFGVICDNKINELKNERSIKHFDSDSLLQFGKIIEKGNYIYAQIVNRIPVADLINKQTSNSTLTSDIKSILNQKTNLTTKETMILARAGQGNYRAKVLKMWNLCCCVTGVTILDAIRASHIKPWSKSDDTERLDPNNGLPLIATLDALFDAGLISFSEDGELLVSNKIDSRHKKMLGLSKMKLNKKPNNKILSYLDYHRKNIFIDNVVS
jgi:hypothetical protein